MFDYTFTSIAKDAIQVITRPIEFYREMEKSGGFAVPSLFLIVMAIVTGLTISTLTLFGTNVTSYIATGYSAAIMIPMAVIIESFIGAAILLGIWKLFGSHASFETAFRCTAYASAIVPLTIVLGLIPYIGIIIKVVWPIYLIYIASIEVFSQLLRWPGRYRYF